jgi:hypothetical protein
LSGRRLQAEAGAGAADVGQQARAVRQMRKGCAIHVSSFFIVAAALYEFILPIRCPDYTAAPS